MESNKIISLAALVNTMFVENTILKEDKAWYNKINRLDKVDEV